MALAKFARPHGLGLTKQAQAVDGGLLLLKNIGTRVAAKLV
jgi:hypothetical protein